MGLHYNNRMLSMDIFGAGRQKFGANQVLWGAAVCSPPNRTNKKAVLSQKEQRDAAVNFDTYRILKRVDMVYVR